MTTTLHLAFLGGFRAVSEDTAATPPRSAPLTGFASAKTQALLAYLACTRQRHSRDALAAMFWGETDDEAAKTSLRQSLANLKKLVEAHVLIERDAVEFDARSSYALDVQAFERGAAGDPSAQREALALYKGDLLKGLVVKNAPEFEEWLVVERERLRQMAAHILRHLAAADAQAGDPESAIAHLHALVALDPLDEPAHRDLMLQLARNGQRAAALAQFEACRRILEKELGVPPEMETRRLHERIRGAQRTMRLPAEATPLVGREAELSKLSRWLADPACRLVTLTGLGGSGKTRLALRAAWQNGSRLLHGACFVSLTSAEDETTLSMAVLAALGTPAIAAASAADHVRDYLRDKELLLVLDNAEHLIESCAPYLVALMKDAPDVKLLLTSRERLSLRGEWSLALDGLPSEGVDAPAVRLFQEVASRVRGEDIAASDAAVRLCRRLQGLPLAIELAAPLTRLMSIPQIEAALANDLAVLSTGMRDVDERHRSLRAAFDQSWHSLAVSEARVLAALSVFRGGFTAAAAGAVAGATPAAIADLMDKSLLQHPADARFDLHELVRQYARERLDHERDVLLRHCDFFADWLAASEPLRRGPRQKELSDALRADFDNIRLMWDTAVRERRASAFDKAAACLFWICDVLGRQQEGMRLFAAAADGIAAEAGCGATRGRLMLRQGVLARLIGEFDQAEVLLTQAEALLHDTGDARNLAYAICQLGIFPVVRGDIDLGLARFSRSLRLYRDIGDLRGASDALQCMGVAEARQGKLDAAEQLYQEAADILTELGDEMELAVALNNLGDVAYYRGHLDQALAHQHAAIAIQRRHDDRRNLAISLNNAAEVLCQLQHFAEALEMAQESADLFREMGSRDGQMNALKTMALALLDLGETGAAITHFDQALSLGLQMHADAEVLTMLLLGARLLRARGRDEDAARMLVAIRRNPAATAFAVERAAAMLTDVPPDAVARAEASDQTWALQQMVGVLRSAAS